MVLAPPAALDSPVDPVAPILRRRPRPGKRWVVDAAAVAGGVGLGAAMALPISQTSLKALNAPGGIAILAGDITAMAGTYLLLVMVLLAGRIPALERVLGQARLLRWHRRLSSAPLVLLGAHGVLTTLGYAESVLLGIWSEAGSLITSMDWILATLVAYAMLVFIAGISIRVARRRFSYDTWWVIHLYTYLALAFSVPHQIFDGTNFAGNPLAKTLWLVVWLATAGVVIIYRLGLPAARSIYYRPRIVQIQPEGPNVYSLVVSGHRLDRLRVAGGQYFGWRFLTRGMWWHAHPFSLSAAPVPPYMRVTIKVAGDSTAQIARLRPGTRIAIEGPYGSFTDAARTQHKVALIGAGVGITPLRSLLEDIPQGVDVIVVQRASEPTELIHRAELTSMVAARGGRLIALPGSRRIHQLDDPRYLADLIPDLSTRDLYVCGPESFSVGVITAARVLGVDPDRIHHESFEI